MIKAAIMNFICDLHFAKNPLENGFLSGAMILSTLAIFANFSESASDIRAVGASFFVYSASVLATCITGIMKKSNRLAKVIHAIFILSFLIIASLSFLMVTNIKMEPLTPFLIYQILKKTMTVFLGFLIFDFVLALLLNCNCKHFDDGESSTYCDAKKTKSEAFTKGLLRT